MSVTRYFEYVNPAQNSSKFWQAHVEDAINSCAVLVTAWGRIGSPGQVTRKSFVTRARAEEQMARACREKLAKGYIERPQSTQGTPENNADIIDAIMTASQERERNATRIMSRVKAVWREVKAAPVPEPEPPAKIRPYNQRDIEL